MTDTRAVARPRKPACTALAIGICAWAVTGQAVALPVCPVTDGMAMSYDIVRGGSVIGRHTVQFSRRGPDLTVSIAVEANLSALGVRVYHYEHRGREIWRDGHMVSMDTRTMDAGEVKQVSAHFDPAQNAWAGLAAGTPVTGVLMASSFWNSETVQQIRLLDDETGVVSAVRITPAGQETLTLGARSVPASRFDLVGTSSGSVWYDGSGCWVRALFKSPVDGSLIDVRGRG